MANTGIRPLVLRFQPVWVSLLGARIGMRRGRRPTIASFVLAVGLFASPWLKQPAIAVERSQASRPSLPSPPQRIISLSPHATELLFSAGAGNRVVAVTESCDKPSQVKRLPKVSGFRGTNVEAVIALKPDLVVAWPSGNRAVDIDALRRLGIAIHASELLTLASITAELRFLSQWAANADLRNTALQHAYEADRLTASLRRRYATARKVKVFYQLGAGRLFTLTDKHVVGEALLICGAENIFGGLALPAPEVSAEAVLAARPDGVLVASAEGLITARADWLSRQLFNSAMVSERIVSVDGAQLHRPTLGTFEALRSMCESVDQIRQTLR